MPEAENNGPDRPATKCEIEITPEMTEAGVRAHARWHAGEDPLDWIVNDVFESMLKARCGSSGQEPFR